VRSNLETDVKRDIVFGSSGHWQAAGERDDGHKVDESGAVLSIIEEICLALLVSCEALLHVRTAFVVGMFVGVLLSQTRSQVLGGNDSLHQRTSFSL